jgi:hypothetical protein
MPSLTRFRPLVRSVVPERAYAALSRAVYGPPPWEPGVVLPPPRCPEGFVTGAPHFIGVGVQKAGTSWWHTLLCDHPDAFELDRVPKERHFFARFSHQPFTDDDAAEYHRWFPRPEGRIAGEWTPNYMLHFWTAPLLTRAAPDAKILVLLRDPVERYRSGLFHHLTRGLPRDARLAAEGFHRGLYRDQLAWLARHVPRERILVQQYEACVADPIAELQRTYAFVGLDPEHVPEALTRRVNAARGSKPDLDANTRAQLVELYTPQVRGLVDDGWPVDLDLWKNFRV